MTKLEISLIVVVAGLLAYIYFTWKPAEIITGPTQLELDNFKAKAAIKSDSLRNALQAITATRTKDSIRYVQERVNSSKAISYWKKRVSEAKEQVSDSLPDSTMVIEQAKVIVFQDSVIEKQGERIVSDSLYIQSIQANFDKRLKIEAKEREFFGELLIMSNRRIEAQNVEIKKHRREKRLAFVGAGVIAILGLIR